MTAVLGAPSVTNFYADATLEIEVATGVLSDLLYLAYEAVPYEDGSTVRSTIDAAGRYVDDVKAINARIIARLLAEKGGVQ